MHNTVIGTMWIVGGLMWGISAIITPTPWVRVLNILVMFMNFVCGCTYLF